MAIILITGGSGLVGKELCNYLLEQNHEVRILSRNPKPNAKTKSFFWDVDNSLIDETALENVDHIVHLAGAGIAEKRWTEKRKKEIIDSRINGIKLLTDFVKNKNLKLKSFVGASAIGIYGMKTSDKIYSETDNGVPDFLSEVCIKWENSYNSITSYCERTCVLRLGVVISKKGGALKKLLPLFKLGLGSAVGTGKQFMPWIDMDDLVAVINHSLFNSNYIGTYNVVAPEHITNKQFSLQLAKSLSKPFFMPPIPSFILKFLYGEMANVLLLGSRISNVKLVSTGFKFKFPTISSALTENLKQQG